MFLKFLFQLFVAVTNISDLQQAAHLKRARFVHILNICFVIYLSLFDLTYSVSLHFYRF